jgi:signal transduction histidine kinase
MHEIELLHTIRPIWLHRSNLALTRGATLRDDLNNQLERFFDLITQVVETGDPAWLDSILSVWATSLTQTDLESQASNLTQFINQLLSLTILVCRETLDESQALNLISVVMPPFSYAFEKAAQAEIQVRIAYVSNQLRQVQQNLERLDRSKSDFIAVAAHELKTPLTLVDGYAAMLRESMDLKSDQEQITMINGIHNGTRRLRLIIDDMIDVSLIDNHLLKLNFQPVWVNRLLVVVEAELKQACKERRLNLEINDFPGSDEMTFGDPERLLQVFRNVLTNAVKFTPDGGKIKVDGRKLPGFIEVTFIDSGIGISPEDQPIIFERFTRIGNISLHSSGKTKFKGGGPGLGLHISKGILEEHGGAIWVESPGYDEKNCPGSIFHVLIPLLSEPPDQKMAKLFESLPRHLASANSSIK